MILQRVLNLVRTLARRIAFERLQRAPHRFVRLRPCRSTRAMCLRERRGELARAFAEHEQIGQRVAAEPVGAVDARRAFARGEQSRHRRHLRVGVAPARRP